jgi:oligopeptide transport system substrate-binding protein
MRRYRSFFALFGLMCALSLTGCRLPWPFPKPDPELPDAHQDFSPLGSGSQPGDVATLDPALIQFSVDSGMAQLIFPQLLTLDERQQPVVWAAESHEISADGLTYIFHLHKGMTWANGTPIGATAFAYSINRALDPCLESYVVSYSLFDLAGAEPFHSSACPDGAVKSTDTLIGAAIQTLDPLTLRLTLARPAGYFLAALTSPPSWAVPQALVERYTHLVVDANNHSSHAVTSWTDHLLDNGPFGGLYLLTTWQHPATCSLGYTPTTRPNGSGRLTFERNKRF